MKTIPQYLKNYCILNGIPLKDAHRIPIDQLREAQQALVFPNMRSILLGKKEIHEKLQDPIHSQILVTRVGACEDAEGHSMPRPDGSLDHFLHICTNGMGYLETDEGTWTLKKGDAFTLNAKEAHHYWADEKEPWSLHWIHLTGKIIPIWFDKIRTQKHCPVFQLDSPATIVQLIDKCFQWLDDSLNNYNQAMAQSVALEILNVVLHENVHEKEQPLKPILEYIDLHIQKKHTVEELAQLANCSKTQLYNLFKKETGYSPIDFCLRQKINKAAQMLINTNYTIQKISHTMGFEDPYYFSRLFKKIIGESPRKYRK